MREKLQRIAKSARRLRVLPSRGIKILVLATNTLHTQHRSAFFVWMRIEMQSLSDLQIFCLFAEKNPRVLLRTTSAFDPI
jgi:hypothetical protein